MRFRNVLGARLVGALFLWVCGAGLCEAPAAESSAAEAMQPDADRAWQILISGAQRPARKPGENPLQYFMREVELAAIRRRELGLQFWNRYPEDPRRYQWLVLTVHLPPHYALDIDDWARRETRLEPNAAVLDEAALAQWESVYPGLRRTLLEAPQVTPEQRRFLWFGELRQAILRQREAAARLPGMMAANERFYAGLGALRTAFRQLMADTLEFAAAWPRELSTSDDSMFCWIYWDLVGGIVQASPLVQLPPAEKHAFVHQLFDILRASGFQPRPGTIYLNPTFVQHAEEEVYYAPVILHESGQPWGRLPPRPKNQGDSPESRIVHMHEHMVAARKYREIGLRLWRESPDYEQQLRWLVSTQERFTPFHFDRLEEGVRMMAGEPARGGIDRDALAQWEAVYPRLRQEMLADPRTGIDARRKLHHAEMFTQYMNTSQLFDAGAPPAESTAALRRLMAGIHELYTRHDNAYGARELTLLLFHAAGRFGLDDAALQAFTAPMLDFADKGLRELAEGKQRLLHLRRTPLELGGVTLEGEPFDLADLRGKIVLLEFWSTGCQSCLPPKPRLHELYLKYRHRGFEVVSVSLDAVSQRRKVERIRTEMGLTWRTLNAEGQRQEIMRRFGYTGVPNYMLLDRQGRLISADAAQIGARDEAGSRRLEGWLQELLSQ